MSRAPTVTAFAAVLAVGALVGCDDPPAVAAPVPTLVAHADQTRPDAAAGGRLQVVVENTGDVPFTVTSVQLLSPGFTTEQPVDKDAELAGGRRVSLPAPFGAARCEDAPQPAEVALGLRVAGQDRAARVPLRSDNGLLDRLHAKECASAALAEQVELALSAPLLPVVVDGEPALQATLTVTRRSADGPVALAGARGSVLYDVVLPDGPAVLAAGERALATPVLLASRTCSGHAIGEAKKPYAFLAFLAVADGEQVPAALPVGASQQAQLLDLLALACPEPTSTP